MSERYRRGVEIIQQLSSGSLEQFLTSQVAEVAPDFARMAIEFPFGDLYSRADLGMRDREIVAIAALATLGHGGPQLRHHVAAATKLGISKAEIVEILMQSAVFFVPAFLAALLFVLAIAAGERALFGRRPARKTNAYSRAFGVAFPLLYLAASVALLWWAERAALRQAPGSLIAPLLAALAPFGAAPAALVPAAVVAGLIALVGKAAA